MTSKLAAIALLFALVFALLVGATINTPKISNERKIFWTWDRLEPDTLASIWLLQRFVEPGCEIRLVANRARPKEGIPFDVPLCELSRNASHSTFWVIQQRYLPKSLAIEKMSRILDEIEITHWEHASSSSAQALESELRDAVSNSSSPDIAIHRATEILDRLFEGTK